ncbi:sugar O-acetyltransferase [Nocardioides sp. WV_118_6]|uniref:sugar O-acetyltransferase n=1 Tax=Nocardioides simplex TaxID=2045 RepID=UPI00215015E0|nr:sugar O-acetyltransferase [Pimelobacter simplex]UUW91689.1 sugar O-acetyltransferase [Pimelobacter simplex]UUW95517.1 sugar O-acetyltransferase [Pimelobacter simplex]
MSDSLRRMLAGEWYLDDDHLRARRHRCRLALEAIDALGAAEDEHRSRLLADLLGQVGRDVRIEPTFRCSYGAHIRLGDRVFVNHDAIFMDDAPITVGDDVRLGPRVQLLTAQHPVDDPGRRRTGWERALPITLGSNAWLGGGVIVLPGVTVGADAVVGAGSVVTRDVAPGAVVVGNPARQRQRKTDSRSRSRL